MLRAFGLLAASLVLSSFQALADTPADLEKNAALRYWQGFAQLPKFDDAEQKKLMAECVTMPLDDHAREIVLKADYAFLMLHRGATLRDCVWAIGSEEGIRARLPHTQAARVMVPLVCLRARMRFENGRTTEAIDDIIDGMTLSRHISQDGLLIAVLFGYAFEQRLIDTVALFVPKLDPSTINALKARLDALPPGGNPSAAMKFEEHFTLDWFTREVTEAEKQKNLASFFNEFFGTPAKGRAFLDACGGNLDGVLKSIQQTRTCYQRTATKMALPLTQFLKEFERELENQAQNPVFMQLFPSLPRVAWALAAAKTRRELLMAALAVRVDGPKALNEHPDPTFGASFDYLPFEGGFELRSKAKMDDSIPAKFQHDPSFNKPVVLVVGRREH